MLGWENLGEVIVAAYFLSQQFWFSFSILFSDSCGFVCLCICTCVVCGIYL